MVVRAGEGAGRKVFGESNVRREVESWGREMRELEGRGVWGRRRVLG